MNGQDVDISGQDDLQLQINAIIRNMKSALATFYIRENHTCKINFCNQQYYSLFEYTQEQYENEVHTALDLIYIEDRESVKREILALASQEDSTVIRARFVKRSGDMFWGDCRISQMMTEQKMPLYISVLDDVTEAWEQQDRMEREYNKQNVQRMSLARDSLASANLNFTMNSIRERFSKTEIQRKILYKSTTVDSFFDNIYAAISDKEERETFQGLFSREKMIRAYNEGRKHIECDHNLTMEGEETIWVSTLVDLIKNPFNGDIEGNAYSIDISAVKNQELILSAVTKDTFDRLMSINLKNDSFFMMEKDEGSFDNNEHVKKGKYTEFIEEDIRNRKIIEPEEDEIIQRLAIKSIRKGLEHSSNYVFTTREENQYDNNTETKKYTFSYIDKKKEIVLMSIFDITEAVNEKESQNRKLKKALNLAKEASRAKSEFLTSMSHEIRTPLNAVIGIADVGMEEGTTPKDRAAFKKVAAAGDYLLGLVNDILEMSRIESGKVILQMETVSARQFLQDTIEIIKPPLLRKNIQIITDFEGVGEEYIRCDVLRTRQIYVNLLSNAIKFSYPDSEIKWSVRKIQEQETKLGYESVIIDYGCGISKEFQKRMFNPFERENNTFMNSTPGTGLGLSICKNIIEQIGGHIQIESEPSKGTRVTVRIVHEEGCQEEIRDKWIQTENTCDLSDKHVLLVEDNEINAEIVNTILCRKGALVTLANNGAIAVDMYKQSDLDFFDLILMDIRMPVMDGISASKKIRELSRKDAKNVPIIAMTADAFMADIRKTKQAGMDAHLSKPVRPKILYDIIDTCLKK